MGTLGATTVAQWPWILTAHAAADDPIRAGVIGCGGRGTGAILNLINSIRAGQPLNEARAMAESTLAGIMGRESAYSGQTLTWDQVYHSTLRWDPEKLEFGSLRFPEAPIPGRYTFL